MEMATLNRYFQCGNTVVFRECHVFIQGKATLSACESFNSLILERITLTLSCHLLFTQIPPVCFLPDGSFKIFFFYTISQTIQLNTNTIFIFRWLVLLDIDITITSPVSEFEIWTTIFSTLQNCFFSDQLLILQFLPMEYYVCFIWYILYLDRYRYILKLLSFSRTVYTSCLGLSGCNIYILQIYFRLFSLGLLMFLLWSG